MRNLFLLLILAASIKAHAQVGLNVSVISPPIWETVNIGRSQYYKNTTKTDSRPDWNLTIYLPEKKVRLNYILA